MPFDLDPRSLVVGAVFTAIAIGITAGWVLFGWLARAQVIRNRQKDRLK